MRLRIGHVCVAAVGAGAIVLASSCKNPAGPSQNLTTFVAGATAISGTPVQGSQQPGQPPPPQPSGPPSAVQGSGTTFDNGANAYSLTSTSPFQKVFISVSSGGAGAPVLDGFFQIDLPAAVTATDVLVQFGADLPSSTFSLRFQVASPAGVAGSASTVQTQVVSPPPGVVTFAGQVVQISAPPGVHLIESDTTASFFLERSGVLLSAPVVVEFSSPGTYLNIPPVTTSIPAGLRVDSYYLIANPVGADPNNSRFYNGDLTFDTDVVGLAVFSNLGLSDAILGAPGTVYTLAQPFEPLDFVVLSANRRTLSFESGASAGLDNLRIIVASPQPGAQTQGRR